MRRSTTIRFAVMLTALTAACSSNPAPSNRPRFDAALITREQILEGQFTNAYDAVKILRGSWLNTVRPESFRYPAAVQVYLDGVRVGDISALSTVQTLPVQYIRYYNAQDATSRWGMDHGAGAIYVSTKVAPQGMTGPPPA
ncbi:MAG: hypothetical protein Q8K55_16560 [Gemmatimonadaceae bacterium]|nr:hypothetical protein [Gemmatimonadaceae bacterium]